MSRWAKKTGNKFSDNRQQCTLTLINHFFLSSHERDFQFIVHAMYSPPIILEYQYRKVLFTSYSYSCIQTIRSHLCVVLLSVALSAAQRAIGSVLGRVAVQRRGGRIGVRSVQNESAQTG